MIVIRVLLLCLPYTSFINNKTISSYKRLVDAPNKFRINYILTPNAVACIIIVIHVYITDITQSVFMLEVLTV